jgi:phosphoribosylformimino-5-aminoimidazole carboxamide ribotide isomerase
MDATPSFTIFPAIDLRGGQVVRLKEGDPNRQTSYSADPAAAARRWISAGARWLHVVNLDGAFGESTSANLAALAAILLVAVPAGIPVQFGGGLRSIEAIQSVLDLGVTRAVLGTIVVEQPQVLKEALASWGSESFAASLDARDGRVQVRGWQSATPLLATDLARTLKQSGLRWLVFTDIARDGLQTGLNLPATVELARQSGLDVIASGGVSSLEDVRQARSAGLSGAIVGRALYESTVDPAQLFALDTSGA